MVKVQNKNTFFCTKMKYCKDDDHKSKPSLCLQEEKNSVRLFRVDPVCIIITFSVRQSRHILEEGVKGCDLVRIFHLMEWSTPLSFKSHTWPARVVLFLCAECLKLVLWLA